MIITRFGKEVRKLRIDHDITLKDLADRIGVTSTFVSAVEAGRKSIPPNFVQKVVAAMDLGPKEAAELRRAADQSAREQRIVLPSTASPLMRETASALARNFEDLTSEELMQIRSILGDR